MSRTKCLHSRYSIKYNIIQLEVKVFTIANIICYSGIFLSNNISFVFTISLVSHIKF